MAGFFSGVHQYTIVAGQSTRHHPTEMIVVHEMAHPYVYEMLSSLNWNEFNIKPKAKDIKEIEELVVRYVTMRRYQNATDNDFFLPMFPHAIDEQKIYLKNIPLPEAIQQLIIFYCSHLSSCSAT